MIKHHYLVYNGTKYGPFDNSDDLFKRLAALVMREPPQGQARWITVEVDDVPTKEEGRGECND